MDLEHYVFENVSKESVSDNSKKYKVSDPTALHTKILTNKKMGMMKIDIKNKI